MLRLWILPFVFLLRADHSTLETTPARFEYAIEVHVTDRETGAPVRGAQVSIMSGSSFRTLAKGLTTNGNGKLSATIAVEPNEIANDSYWVSPAFPNPVLSHQGNVTIRYAVLGDANDKPVLEVVNAAGRRVHPGGYLPAGTYFYRLFFDRGVTSQAQSISIAEGKRLKFDLVAEHGREFLSAGDRLQGVGRLGVETILVASADGYSVREAGWRLNWRWKQDVEIQMSGSNTAARYRTAVASPDGRTSIQLTIKDTNRDGDCLFYRVLKDGAPVVLDSRLGLGFSGEASIGCGLEITDISPSSASEIWRPPYGQNESISDIHNAITVELTEYSDPNRTMGLDVRAYDEGIAFRYRVNDRKRGAANRISAEHTQVRFPAGAVAYAQYKHEEPYFISPVHGLEENCRHPLTVDLANGGFAVFAEANNDAYPLSLLDPLDGPDGTLQTRLLGHADIYQLPFLSPWRVFVLGDRPGDLIENAHIVENLSGPNQLRESDWIRPGKVIRAGLSTDDGKHAVDFATKRNIQYVIFDAGWYGDQWSKQSDAARPIQGLDVQEVVSYADQFGVGVLLYVNKVALENQLEEILSVYNRWGVRGIKAGFVDVGSQRQTRFLRQMVKAAAEHELVVNIHDAYQPDGYSRTFPNLLTQEGIRGNEHMPGARHNTILPFTRYIIGAGDYTPGFGNLRIGTSYAHQLALAVVFYSPLQFLFWTDNPSAHVDDPAITFWDAMPTVWDETRVLNGSIGEYVTTARRSGDDWFVGSITNEHARSLDVVLDFLVPGLTYEASIYRDDVDSRAVRAPVLIEERTVDATSRLRIVMTDSGGQGIRIRRKTADH